MTNNPQQSIDAILTSTIYDTGAKLTEIGWERWGENIEEAKAKLLEAIKAAKPEPTKYEKYNSDCLEGFENGVSDYEQNLTKLFGLEG